MAGLQTIDFPARDGTGAHRLFLYVPAGPAPSAGWPLLLASDGNAVFDMAVAMMRTQALDERKSNLVEGVVAAIGYPVEGLYDSAGRSWDLTPPPGRTYPGARGEVRTGGARHFLAFVEDVVLPWLAHHAGVDPARRCLFGHSFGGLFALYTLFSRPALFATYAAASPSLYWEKSVLKPFEDTFFKQPPVTLPARVLLSAGGWEGDELAPHLVGQPDEDDLRADLLAIAKVRRVRALAERFQAAAVPDLTCRVEIFPNESHMSVLPLAIHRAVTAAFAANGAA